MIKNREKIIQIMKIYQLFYHRNLFLSRCIELIPIKIEYRYWYCINLLHCLPHLPLKNSMKAKSSIFCFRLIIVKVLCLIFLFEKKTSLTLKMHTTDITKSTPLYDTKGFVKCWSWKKRFFSCSLLYQNFSILFK